MFKKVVLLCENSDRIDKFANDLMDRAASIGYRLDVKGACLNQASEYSDADMVYLVPQIRFDLESVKSLLPKAEVQVMDMRTFGMKNEDALLDTIRTYFNE